MQINNVAYILRITGDVQGVSYRYWAQKKAKDLGLSGWAKNEHDGSVMIFAQGEESEVDAMIDWAREGSPMASVTNVEVEEAEPDADIRSFEVK